MKVLLVILHADSSRGGAESYCVHLHHSLKARKVDAKLAAASFESGVDLSDRVALDFDGLTRSRKYQAFLDALESHLSETDYDIVHAMLPVRRCDVYHPQAGVESLTFPRAGALQRLTNRRRAMFARVERELLEHKRPPVVLCMSDRSRAETQSAFLIDTSRLITLYNGVESERFVADDVPTDQPWRVVLVGQDFERKGVDIAIRSIATYNRSLRSGDDTLRVMTPVLEVIGKDDATRYEQMARELSVNVQFLGQRRDVENVLRGATALIHPARFEPFGMVVPEAMLMGVPPIVSKVSGASEIVRDGVDGIVVDAEDAYAGAIARVIDNHPTMRAACLKRRAELSYGAHLDKLLKIYDRIVAAKR